MSERTEISFDAALMMALRADAQKELDELPTPAQLKERYPDTSRWDARLQAALHKRRPMLKRVLVAALTLVILTLGALAVSADFRKAVYTMIQVISNQYAERLLSEAEKTETYRGLSKIDILHTVSIPQLARTIPLKGLNLSLEKYRMPDGVIIEIESSSHYLGSFSEKNDSSTNWIEKIMEGVGIH